MNSNEVAKWSPSDWRNKIQFMMPTGGGAVGVLLCWAGEKVMNPLYEFKTTPAQFVIKPETGSAAPTKFAETILQKIGNTGSPNTKPIPRTSEAGRAIMEMVNKFKNETPLDKRDRWNQVYPEYLNASFFLIQDFIAGKYEMGDVIREDPNGLRNMLKDKRLMENLGRLFVADAVLGNGDRLCFMNSGNIIYTMDRKFWAIDSTTVLTKYYDVLNDHTAMSWGDAFQGNFAQKPSPSQWAQNVVNHGATATPSQAQKNDPNPRLLPGFAMKVLFEPGQWYEREFKGHLINSINKETARLLKENPKQPPPIIPRPKEWDEGKHWFLIGVEAGLHAVDQKLSGLSWMNIKSKYNHYVSKYGGDSNVDWNNFKIRRMYVKSRRKGLSDEEAMQAVVDYAQRKYPGV